MIRIAIIGATGHTGEVIIDILLNHPQAKITKLYNTSKESVNIADVFPKLKNRLDLDCKETDFDEIGDSCDVVFLALPHTVAMDYVPRLLSMGKKIIDLSSDYRLKDARVYEKSYNKKHKDASGLKEAVYGLPEFYRGDIKKAKLIANPGCYPTAALLSLIPLLALDLIEPDSIIIDAKSGISGAGKKVSRELLFIEVNEDFHAYKVNEHQHMPEINQIISKVAGKKLQVTFVPHLLPINRGILETIYVKKSKDLKVKKQNLIELYKRFYKNEPFVRIKKEGEFPRLKDVVGTNFCDIGLKEDTESIIVISAIDNLLKGASGQAVQNMNIMFNFPEKTGLML